MKPMQRPPQRPEPLKRLIAILVFVYTFVSFGLSGLAQVSRLSFISAAAIMFLLLVRKQKLRIPRWVWLMTSLYLYLIIT